MTTSIRVLAHITARPDRIAELRAVLEGLVEPTRRETGCITYDLCQNSADPAEFAFIEEWRDAAALDAHFETAHIRDAFARIPELVATSPDIRRYTLIV